MRGGEQKQGYTIVEVMIFLAISGFMFILAASFISGKQAKSEFKQGMNDINNNIRQVINDVSNGYYPSSGDFACSAGASGVPTFPPTSPNELGANKGCTFIGKVMQFGVGSTSSTTYNTYSIVGRQFQGDAETLAPPLSFQQAKPFAMTGAAGSKDLTVTENLQWGLELEKMFNGTTPIGAFGFFSGFATTTDTNLDSGAAAPIAIAVPGSALGQGATNIDSQMSSIASGTVTVDTKPEIIMCFKGGARQFGRLTIGTGDNQDQRLSTHIQISTGTPSAGCTT